MILLFTHNVRVVCEEIVASGWPNFKGKYRLNSNKCNRIDHDLEARNICLFIPCPGDPQLFQLFRQVAAVGFKHRRRFGDIAVALMENLA